jgi:hypothetical protein
MTPPGRLPTFLIIGAPKAGTTSFFDYLTQHPDVYGTPFKDPMFFSYDPDAPAPRGIPPSWDRSVTDLSAYMELFSGARHERALGEASTNYIHDERAPSAIKRYVPNARIIAILRDPTERAYSSFLHLRREGVEPIEDFAEAVAAEPQRRRDGWAPFFHYVGVGHYTKQLQRYFDLFPREQIRIYLYEDLKDQTLTMMQDAFEFLDVDPEFEPDIATRHNVAGIPRSSVLHRTLNHPSESLRNLLRASIPAGIRQRIYRSLHERNLQPPPKMSPEVRRRLKKHYNDEIIRLSAMLNRDLSSWLT